MHSSWFDATGRRRWTRRPRGLRRTRIRQVTPGETDTWEPDELQPGYRRPQQPTDCWLPGSLLVVLVAVLTATGAFIWTDNLTVEEAAVILPVIRGPYLLALEPLARSPLTPVATRPFPRGHSTAQLSRRPLPGSVPAYRRPRDGRPSTQEATCSKPPRSP